MNLFKPDSRVLMYGQVVEGQSRWAMMHPEIKVLKSNEKVVLSDRLTPVYTSALGVGSARIIGWVDIALKVLQNELLSDFSPDFLQNYQLRTLKESLLAIHQPQIRLRESDILSADNPHLRRVVLDELLAKHIGMLRKKAYSQQFSAFALTIDEDKQQALLSQLAFTLTNAQTRVISEIFADIARDKPMHRLVQGDVGSGKQAQKLLEPMGISCGWLSGKLTAKNRRELLEQIADGSINVVIGTHALFQADVVYHKLGLAIIDEQHRFGVHQRLLLKEKAENTGKVPHMLVMTATPIPRTLAMSYYADLDTSIIDELPPNRQTIDTILLADNRREELIQRIDALVAKGQQVYWVCPLIEESEVLQAQAAQDIFDYLQNALPNITVALLHGKQKSDEKAQIIADFQANKTQLLVSTTVIEVGVDVPNATLMVIENADYR